MTLQTDSATHQHRITIVTLFAHWIAERPAAYRPRDMAHGFSRGNRCSQGTRRPVGAQVSPLGTRSSSLTDHDEPPLDVVFTAADADHLPDKFPDDAAEVGLDARALVCPIRASRSLAPLRGAGVCRCFLLPRLKPWAMFFGRSAASPCPPCCPEYQNRTDFYQVKIHSVMEQWTNKLYYLSLELSGVMS